MIITISKEDDIIQEKNKLRDNAITQSNLLIEYKNSLFTIHPIMKAPLKRIKPKAKVYYLYSFLI